MMCVCVYIYIYSGGLFPGVTKAMVCIILSV